MLKAAKQDSNNDFVELIDCVVSMDIDLMIFKVNLDSFDRCNFSKNAYVSTSKDLLSNMLDY